MFVLPIQTCYHCHLWSKFESCLPSEKKSGRGVPVVSLSLDAVAVLNDLKIRLCLSIAKYIYLSIYLYSSRLKFNKFNWSVNKVWIFNITIKSLSLCHFIFLYFPLYHPSILIVSPSLVLSHPLAFSVFLFRLCLSFKLSFFFPLISVFLFLSLFPLCLCFFSLFWAKKIIFFFIF